MPSDLAAVGTASEQWPRFIEHSLKTAGRYTYTDYWSGLMYMYKGCVCCHGTED